ncbi:hypothetical protein ACFSWE_16150 [Leucobacter albus]|uniref:Nudix hydrolase domain-containing protein n=1 Tax=Leucobacter albus TaxID=272210 RepID=A0ABW3TLR3_9MICO
MVKVFYGALIALIVAFAISEFTGLWPEQFGSVSRLNDLLGVLAILLVVASLGAMTLPSVVAWSFRKPLLREYKCIAKAQKASGTSAGQAGSAAAPLDHAEFFEQLTHGICAFDDHTDTSPARLIAQAGQRTRTLAEWPWQLPELAPWATGAESRLRANVVLRFLMRERLETVTGRLQTLHAYARSFPAAPPGIAEGGAAEGSRQLINRRASRAFSSQVERHTGASVLATGLHTRAGVDTVRLWHSDRVRSQNASGDRRPTDGNFVKNHFPGDARPAGRKARGTATSAAAQEVLPKCEWEKKLQADERYLIGDRDNHVPILDGVTVSENRWAGTVEFVLSTHSSCSAATDHSPYACKGAADALGLGASPIWAEEQRVVKRNYSASQQGGEGHEEGLVKPSVLESNLAVHVVLVITDEQNNRYLVLVRRGNTFRFGNAMLTVPSETIALAAGGHRGYTDEHGAPDLRQHALSGLRRALGMDLTPTQLRPSHVVMVNQRESLNSASGGRSQLVCSVGFTASLACSKGEIEAALAQASRVSQHGVQGVVFLPLGTATGAASDAEAEAQANATVDELFEDLAARRPEMDQMSTTAALIVAGRLLGIGRLTDALKSLAGGSEWWNAAWHDEPSGPSRAAVGLAQSRVIPQ